MGDYTLVPRALFNHAQDSPGVQNVIQKPCVVSVSVCLAHGILTREGGEKGWGERDLET